MVGRADGIASGWGLAKRRRGDWEARTQTDEDEAEQRREIMTPCEELCSQLCTPSNHIRTTQMLTLLTIVVDSSLRQSGVPRAHLLIARPALVHHKQIICMHKPEGTRHTHILYSVRGSSYTLPAATSIHSEFRTACRLNSVRAFPPMYALCTANSEQSRLHHHEHCLGR